MTIFMISQVSEALLASCKKADDSSEKKSANIKQEMLVNVMLNHKDVIEYHKDVIRLSFIWVNAEIVLTQG